MFFVISKAATVAAPKQVATIIVKNGTKILMGKRNDNGRYTNPGGHMDTGEDKYEAAARELYEEAGIKVDKKDLEYLGTKNVTTFTGKKMTIHAFMVESNAKPTSKNDPDKEVNKWEWIETKDGLPESVSANLHSPKNVALNKMGLQKSMMDFAIEEFYIEDLIKSAGGGHKYIRKYQRGGKWIYIYHEPGQHGRRMDPAEHEAIRRLAESGHEHSKKLIDSTEEHPQAKLDALRRLADSGHEEPHKHLQSLGINREKERLEEQLVPKVISPKDKMDKDLSAQDLTKMRLALKKEINASQQHLSGHQNGEIGLAVYPVLNSPDLMTKLDKATTLREGLDALGKITERLETAQGAISASRPGEHRTYGNLIYNKGLEALKADGLIPQEYVDEHKRLHRTGASEHKDLKGIQERADSRAERERIAEEAERRELGEYFDKAKDVGEYFGETMSVEDIKKVAKGIMKFFGKDFDIKFFASSLNPNPAGTSKITISDDFYSGLKEWRTRIDFSFLIKDSVTGERITAASRDITKNSDGSLSFHNHHFMRPSNEMLKKHSGMSKGMYAGVERFLKEVTKNYPAAAKKNSNIYMGAANSGFGDGFKGALLWAKHFFAFKHDRDLEEWKTSNKRLMADAITRMPAHLKEQAKLAHSKIDSFEQPWQFVKTGVLVTKAEALTILDRRALDFDFNEIFAKTTVDLGELLVTQSQLNFKGISYFNKSDPPAGELNGLRSTYYGRASGARPTTANNYDHIVSPKVKKMLKASRGRMTVTAARLLAMESWSKEEVKEFYDNAPIAAAAKEKVKDLLNRIGG